MTSTTIPERPTPAQPEADPVALDVCPEPWRDVAIFLGLTYAFGIAGALALPGTVQNPGPVAGIALITPMVVVGLVRLIARLRRGPANPFPLGLRRLSFRSWPAAVALPAVPICASFALAWALGVVRFHGLAGYVTGAPINIAVMTILVLGEEIGWRSYVFPRLASVMPVRRAALVTGFAQGLFHLPLLLLTPAYDGAGSRWIVAPGVVIVLTAAGPMFGWLRTRSHSLWPVAIAHATANTCLIEAPFLIAHNQDLAAYLTGEGGVFTVIAVVASAVLVWRRFDWTPRVATPLRPAAAQARAVRPARG